MRQLGLCQEMFARTYSQLKQNFNVTKTIGTRIRLSLMLWSTEPYDVQAPPAVTKNGIVYGIPTATADHPLVHVSTVYWML